MKCTRCEGSGTDPLLGGLWPEVRRGREGLIAVTNEKPKPGSPEWQTEFNEQVRQHDQRVRADQIGRFFAGAKRGRDEATKRRGT